VSISALEDVLFTKANLTALNDYATTRALEDGLALKANLSTLEDL